MNRKIGIVLISIAGLLTIGALVVGIFFNCSDNDLRAGNTSYRMRYGMQGRKDYDSETYGEEYRMHRRENYDSETYSSRYRMHEDENYGGCHEEYDVDSNNYRKMR